MNKKIQIFLVIFGMLSPIIISTEIVFALPVQHTISHPEKITHQSFSKIEQGLTNEHMRGHRSTQQTSSNENCLTYTHGVNGKSDVGILIYRFGHIIGWCYNGSKVTYHEHIYIIEAYNVWKFKQITSESHEASAGNEFWRDIGTAEFAGGVVGVDFQSCYPSVSAQVNGDGTHSGSESVSPDACN